MAIWQIRLKYIEAKDEYHLYRWNVKKEKWDFLYNFMPCPNIKDFIELLQKEDITFKWKHSPPYKTYHHLGG